MRKITLKSVLMTALLAMSSITAWAAGYTRTLSDALVVPGYKANTFYDFQNNNPEVLPTSGDLRYREGGIWGLHNFGSGTRSGEVAIPVTVGQILVFQTYNADYPQISCGTKNATLSSSTGYAVYDITSDADKFTITAVRYAGVIAALVMDKDKDASNADYTITYMAGEKVVKTVEGNVAVGTIVPVEKIFEIEGVKYILDEGEAESLEVAAGGSTLEVAVHEAPVMAYTLKDNFGNILGTGSAYESDIVSVPYNRFVLESGILYEAPSNNKEYNYSFTLTQNNQEEVISYSQAFTNAVFYTEAQDIPGMTETTEANANIRCSKGAGAFNGTEGDIIVTNLPAGMYAITMGVWGNAGVDLIVKCGENELAVPTLGYITQGTLEFTITEATDVVIPQCGDAKHPIDYIFIQEVVLDQVSFVLGDSESFASYVPSYAADFKASGVTAYVATAAVDGVVTLESVEAVPAGTPVLVKGTKGATVEIKKAAAAEAPAANLLKAATGAVLNENQYVLAYTNEEFIFAHLDGAIELPAGKVYLEVEGAGEVKAFRIAGTATAVESVKAAQADGRIFNLAGQRVNKAQKGIYVVNGKKIVK